MLKNCLSASLVVLALAMSVSTQAFAKDTPAIGSVGREVTAPPWSAACTTDQGPSQCGEPVWVYGSPVYVSRFKNAF
jgi:hypothetical protein